MIKRAGFTLIEVVFSLGIVAVVMATLFQGQRNLARRTQVDLPTVDWYLMLHELENPDHHFVFTAISNAAGFDEGHSAVIVNEAKDKEYRLTYFHVLHQIVLMHKGGGRIIMMRGVSQFHIEPDMTLTMTTDHGIHFKVRLLLPDRRHAPDEETPRDDSAVSD
ncbi:prepilin-type N-terminal cleavage/methylation domain-containing protein [Lactiplantibacillus pentosus]|uniref:prepilin-type N-terminal cleavage/methylation domain-containing protein n=1 Tax=Lactiplantibacillus pentosus TaxID=1589 RepID=UPI00259BDDCF|nr:prepilin-type N-terminal cleavage/methylation domain-containing protein [Lactiplantibacillus pentosus]WFC02128.1 prepilin-type N-terminal cleavage/methylation domain-containing protein [Lactiplantibacillus pentosus]